MTFEAKFSNREQYNFNSGNESVRDSLPNCKRTLQRFILFNTRDTRIKYLYPVPKWARNPISRGEIFIAHFPRMKK